MAANIFCVCGPKDSYFCNSPSKWVRYGHCYSPPLPVLRWKIYSNNLPKRLEDAMKGQSFDTDTPFTDAYNVAIGPNDTFYIGGSKKSSGTSTFYYDTTRTSTNLPEGLRSWLDAKKTVRVNGKSDERRARDIPSTRVVLGPGGSYFAIDNTSYAYGSLPDGLLEFFKSVDIAADPVKVIALGLGGSYLALTTNGAFSYDLTGSAKSLDESFDERVREEGFDWVRNIMAFSLCPDTPGRYFLTMNNGMSFGSNPASWDPIIQPVWDDILETMKPKPKPVPRIVAAPQRTAAAPQRVVNRQQKRSSGLSTLMGGLKLGVQVLNGINRANGGGGGGGGDWSGGQTTYTTFDTYDSSSGGGFWQPIQSAASDPIQ